MRPFTTLASLTLPALIAAAPARRAAAANDLLVLQFAFVLEQLETQFYTQGLQKFQASDFTSAGFTSADVAIEQIQTIQLDEATHTSVLHQTILDQGGQPLTSCSFDFSSVLTDVSTMAATARLVEMVGVSAYLGAASLVTDPQLLTAAASILTVEARHQSLLNVLSGSATAIPQAFDIPLSPPQVLAIAGGFISNCDVGVKANPPLKITNTGSVGVGTQLTFDTSSINGSTSNFACQMMVGGLATAIALPLSSCVVPQINGPVAIFITNTMQPLVNSQLVQDSSSIVLGPTMAFIDSQTQTIAQLVRSGGSPVASSSTISSDEASSIQSSGTATVASSGASATNSASSTTATDSSSGSATDTASSSSASSTASVGGTNNVASGVPLQQGGTNFATGPSGDGHTIVEGWSNLPAGISAPSS